MRRIFTSCCWLWLHFHFLLLTLVAQLISSGRFHMERSNNGTLWRCVSVLELIEWNYGLELEPLDCVMYKSQKGSGTHSVELSAGIDRSSGPRPLSYCCYVRHNSRNCQAKSHGEYPWRYPPDQGKRDCNMQWKDISKILTSTTKVDTTIIEA